MKKKMVCTWWVWIRQLFTNSRWACVWHWEVICWGVVGPGAGLLLGTHGRWYSQTHLVCVDLPQNCINNRLRQESERLGLRASGLWCNSPRGPWGQDTWPNPAASPPKTLLLLCLYPRVRSRMVALAHGLHGCAWHLHEVLPQSCPPHPLLS